MSIEVLWLSSDTSMHRRDEFRFPTGSLPPAQCWMIWSVLLARLLPGAASAEEADALQEFAGAHSRVVWVQDHSSSSSDTVAVGQRLRLMGLDSTDGKGERAILAELRNYSKPLMTPNGQRVVFSDQQSQKFYVVNWDGSGKKLLGEGLAVDVWRDPQDFVEWVYFAKRVGKPENVTYRNLRRLKLADPKTVQKVWDQTDVGCDNFQLAADGKKAAGEFPWPNGGIVDLTKQKWQKLDEGCWASIAPDNSGVSWVFDGPHRNLQFHRPDQPTSWKVNINSAPEIQGAEVFHPRWSNHVRYFAVTGPYSVKGAVNMISGGGPQVEIYLGRFSPDFQTVEAWWKVTENSRGDFYPDVWIAGGESSTVELPGLKTEVPKLAVTEWPAVTDGLLFTWNNGAQTNQIAASPGQSGRACQLQLHGHAFPGRFHDVRLLGGTADLQDLDQLLLAACRAKRELTLDLLVTPQATAGQGELCRIGSESQPQVRLMQDGRVVKFEVGTAKGRSVKEIWSAGIPIQLTAVLSADSLKLFVDGEPAMSTSLTPNFKDWKSAAVTLGGNGWRGDLEAVNVYARCLTPEEIRRQSLQTRQRLKSRAPIARFSIRAVCRERSSIPEPRQILPYRRALAVHEFEVQKIEVDANTADRGELKVGERILVAQWVILDGAKLAEASTPKVGDITQLTVERTAEHAELASERQIQEIEALDLPLYYSVGQPP